MWLFLGIKLKYCTALAIGLNSPDSCILCLVTLCVETFVLSHSVQAPISSGFLVLQPERGLQQFFFSCLTAIFNSLSSKFSSDCVNAEGCEEGAVTMSPIPLRFNYNGNSPPLCVIRSQRCAKGQHLLGFPCRSKLFQETSCLQHISKPADLV